MNNLQTAIASLLGIALLAALPGLYFYTELNSTPDGAPRPDDSAEASSNKQPAQRNSTTSNVVDVEPVRVPDQSELPEVSFQLQELTQNERRKVARRMMIDINTAPQSQLEKITGVGPSTAENIISYREEHGGINNLDELNNVSGIGSATIDKLRSEVKVAGKLPSSNSAGGGSTSSSSNPSSSQTSSSSSSSGAKINVNTSGSSKLQEIKGVGPATADKIIKYREENGPFGSLEELGEVKGIGPATIDDMRGDVTL